MEELSPQRFLVDLDLSDNKSPLNFDKSGGVADVKLELPSFENGDDDLLLLNESRNDDHLLLESPAVLQLNTPNRLQESGQQAAEIDASLAEKFGEFKIASDAAIDDIQVEKVTDHEENLLHSFEEQDRIDLSTPAMMKDSQAKHFKVDLSDDADGPTEKELEQEYQSLN